MIILIRVYVLNKSIKILFLLRIYRFYLLFMKGNKLLDRTGLKIKFAGRPVTSWGGVLIMYVNNYNYGYGKFEDIGPKREH